MTLEGQEAFAVTCTRGHTVLRTPQWLRENTHPLCPECSSDVALSRNEAMEAFVASEKKLSEPIKSKD
jgi:hypothetical protein